MKTLIYKTTCNILTATCNSVYIDTLAKLGLIQLSRYSIVQFDIFSDDW